MYDGSAETTSISGTGDLNFEVGADEDFTSIKINLATDDGGIINEDSDGNIIDNDGVELTSGGKNLEWIEYEGGLAGAVFVGLDNDDKPIYDIIFTVTPDISDGEYTGTYTVDLIGVLDGAASELIIPLGEKGGGNALERLIEAGEDTDSDGDPDEILIKATALNGSSRDGSGVMSGGAATLVNCWYWG